MKNLIEVQAIEEGLRIHVSDLMNDPEWDRFLETAPGGHHVQTSRWARVKTQQGWEAKRLLVKLEGAIVAGAQLLIRPLPVAGAFCYVPKGPVLAKQYRYLSGKIVKQICKVAREHGAQQIVVQPPNDAHYLGDDLLGAGFNTSHLRFAPTSTVVVDLTLELDELLSRMKAKTRYNIRLAKRQGIRVREVENAEITSFYRLFISTSERQDFWAESQDYFFQLWRSFSGAGHIKMFLAEHDGVVLSGAIVIAFGDTVLYKRGGWLGEKKHLRPNELLHWHIITWAKSNGYLAYDFEGIAPEAADAVLHNKDLDGALKNSVSRFKLGFGGDISLCPGPYDHIYNPLIRAGYKLVFSKLSQWTCVKKILNRYRTR